MSLKHTCHTSNFRRERRKTIENITGSMISEENYSMEISLNNKTTRVCARVSIFLGDLEFRGRRVESRLLINVVSLGISMGRKQV